MPDPFARQRQRMVKDQIYARGIRDAPVLAAMGSVARELFVPKDRRANAYEDRPLPIGYGQTISQPYIVAYMVEALALSGAERVLEIGAGSGYAAAVLAQIADQIIAIERIEELAKSAAGNLTAADYKNVQIIHGDGSNGWPQAAPYDAILISAASPDVPQSLKDQLKPGGRLIVPLGSDAYIQNLVRVTRRKDKSFKREALADVRFVPLIGGEA